MAGPSEAGPGGGESFERAGLGDPHQFRWRGDDSGCPGGALMTMGVHQADNLNYIFGPIKTAICPFRLYIPAPVEDVTTTILQFASRNSGLSGVQLCLAPDELDVCAWHRSRPVAHLRPSRSAIQGIPYKGSQRRSLHPRRII